MVLRRRSWPLLPGPAPSLHALAPYTSSAAAATSAFAASACALPAAACASKAWSSETSNGLSPLFCKEGPVALGREGGGGEGGGGGGGGVGEGGGGEGGCGEGGGRDGEGVGGEGGGLVDIGKPGMLEWTPESCAAVSGSSSVVASRRRVAPVHRRMHQCRQVATVTRWGAPRVPIRSSAVGICCRRLWWLSRSKQGSTPETHRYHRTRRLKHCLIILGLVVVRATVGVPSLSWHMASHHRCEV